MKNKESPAFLLFEAMDRVRKAWKGVVPCSRLSKSQFGTLMVLASGSKEPGAVPGRDPFTPMTLSELAGIMGHSLPALSQRISLLEGMGYVERVPNPSDRRVTGLRLTPEGLQLLESARDDFVRKLDFVMERLGPQGAADLLRTLEQLARTLEEIPPDTGAAESANQQK